MIPIEELYVRLNTRPRKPLKIMVISCLFLLLWCHCYCNINTLIVWLFRLNEALNQSHELLFCDGVFFLEISGGQRVWL
jgi:hypothetical protein